MTREEAADYLRIHPRSVDKLVLAGKLTRFHLGRSPRFRRVEVASLVEIDDQVGQRAPEQLIRAQDAVRAKHANASGDDSTRAGH